MPANILFICGSLNQTTMMHKIADCLPDQNCFFSPYFAEGALGMIAQTGLLDHSILAGNHFHSSVEYLSQQKLPIDFKGEGNTYDLTVTCTDLIVQTNIRKNRLILVQEGITEAEDFTYKMVRALGLPRFLANTAATGLSDAYDRFCVASQGYRDVFIRKGVKPSKIVITGIPNFDYAQQSMINDFPFRHYVLVATSSIRETGKIDRRTAFLRKVKDLAKGRPILFRLHPNENMVRAEKEIRRIIPEAVIFREGNTNHMIANCELLITQVSSVVFTGIAMGKEVYSYHDLKELQKLCPIQNNGTSAMRIAEECRNLLQLSLSEIRQINTSERRTWLPNWLPSGFD